MNGKFGDPAEKDMHVQMALDANLPPEKRADIVGSAISQNQYKPLDTPTPLPTPNQNSMGMDVGQFSNMLGDIPMSQSGPNEYVSDSVKMLEGMSQSVSQRDYIRSGM
jgi:hypothetical protein